MTDYAFFAMLFYVASTLAPTATHEMTLVNSRHPEQTITWTHGDDGRWALSLNGRELGHFTRDRTAIIHDTGPHSGRVAPDRFELATLANPFARDSQRVRLGSRFGARVLEVSRTGGVIRISDGSREILRVPLLLRSN